MGLAHLRNHVYRVSKNTNHILARSAWGWSLSSDSHNARVICESTSSNAPSGDYSKVSWCRLKPWLGPISRSLGSFRVLCSATLQIGTSSVLITTLYANQTKFAGTVRLIFSDIHTHTHTVQLAAANQEARERIKFTTGQRQVTTSAFIYLFIYLFI